MKNKSRLAVLLAAILACALACAGAALAAATELNSSLSDVEAALSAEDVQAQLVYNRLMECATLKSFFDTLMLEENNAGAYALNEEQLNALYQHITMIYLSVDMEGEGASYYADLVDTLNYLADGETEYKVITLAAEDAVTYSGATWAGSVTAHNCISSVVKGNILEIQFSGNDPYITFATDAIPAATNRYALVVYRANSVCNGKAARVYVKGTSNTTGYNESNAWPAAVIANFQTDLDNRNQTSSSLIGDENIHALIIDVGAYTGNITEFRLDFGGDYGTSVGKVQIQSISFCKALNDTSTACAQHIANEQMVSWGLADDVVTYRASENQNSYMGFCPDEGRTDDTHNVVVSYSSEYSAWKLMTQDICKKEEWAGGNVGLPCTSCTTKAISSAYAQKYDDVEEGWTGREIYENTGRVCDPYVYFDASDANITKDYKYVVITYLCPVSNRADNKTLDGAQLTAEFFPLVNEEGTAVRGIEVEFDIEESVYYRTAVVDLSAAADYDSGEIDKLSGVRIDQFNEVYAYEGDVMYIHSISFCKNTNIIDFIEEPDDMYGNLSYELQVDYAGGTAGTHVVDTSNGESRKEENRYYIEKNPGSSQSERKHTFNWSGEPVRPGYVFDGWGFASSNAGISTSDNSITISLPSETQTDSALVAVMKAEWIELTSTITYKVVGPEGLENAETENKSGFVALGYATASTVNEVSETIGQDSGVPHATAIPNTPNYKFVGWYRDAACTQKIEDAAWVPDAASLKPQKSSTAADANLLYRDATYYALFDYDVADLTIVKKGLKDSDSAIIRVEGFSTSSDQKQTWYISLTGPDATAVIRNMKINTKYTITEMDEWTVYYTTEDDDLGVEKTVNPFVDGENINNTVEITNGPRADKWLHDESCAVNFK